MKTIFDRPLFAPYRSRAFDLYFSDLRIAAFDIETTGLYPNHDRIILSGILPFACTEEAEAPEAVQFFSESPADEEEIVRATLETLQQADVVLTYNGQTFDLPFLKKRAARFGLAPLAEETLASCASLDLYQIIRTSSGLAGALPSLSQTSIERYLDIDGQREDQIDGWRSIQMYEQWLERPEERLEQAVLLHNHDDIAQLARLLPVLKRCDLHGALFRTGFPAGGFLVKNIRIGKDGLTAQVRGRRPLRDYVAFPSAEAPCGIMASAASQEAELRFPAEKIPGGALVLDAEKLLGGIPQDLAALPGFLSGYLVLKEGKKINCMAVNAFLLAYLRTCSWLFA